MNFVQLQHVGFVVFLSGRFSVSVSQAKYKDWHSMMKHCFISIQIQQKKNKKYRNPPENRFNYLQYPLILLPFFCSWIIKNYEDKILPFRWSPSPRTSVERLNLLNVLASAEIEFYEFDSGETDFSLEQSYKMGAAAWGNTWA